MHHTKISLLSKFYYYIISILSFFP